MKSKTRNVKRVGRSVQRMVRQHMKLKAELLQLTAARRRGWPRLHLLAKSSLTFLRLKQIEDRPNSSLGHVKATSDISG